MESVQEAADGAAEQPEKDTESGMRKEEPMQKYPELLRTCILFQDMTPETLSEALQLLYAERRLYRKGAFLHHAGEPLKKFGFVLSGAVQALTDDPDGNRMIMANVIPGGTFGESLAFLKIRETPVYIVARENSGVLWLSPDFFFSGKADAFTRDLRRRFTAMLAARALAQNDRIQILSKLSIREKLITLFTELAREQRSTVFTLPFDREDMAAYIGTNRSALSRELSRMKKEGLIDYYGKTVRILKGEGSRMPG